MRADRLERTANLVDVLAEVAELVAIVVDHIVPLQLAHAQLRIELERTFAGIALGHEALEAIRRDEEGHLVEGLDPRRIAASGHSASGDDGDLGLDEVRDAVGDGVEPERLRVATEPDAAIGTFKPVAHDRLFADLVLAGHRIPHVLADVQLVAERIGDVRGPNELEHLAVILGRVRLGQHFLHEELAEEVHDIEAQGRVRQRVQERDVDLLGIAGKASRETKVRVDVELHTGAEQELRPNVGVLDLENGLLHGLLGLQVTSLEGGTRLLDANPRALSAHGLKLVAILGRADLILAHRTRAHLDVGLELRRGERGANYGAFLHDRTNHVGNVGKRAAIEHVHVRALAGEDFRNAAHDTIDVLVSEVANRGG